MLNFSPVSFYNSGKDCVTQGPWPRDPRSSKSSSVRADQLRFVDPWCKNLPCICIVDILHLDCDFLSSRFELGKFYLAAFLSISAKQFHTNSLYFSFLDEYRLGICELPLVEAFSGVLKIRIFENENILELKSGASSRWR